MPHPHCDTHMLQALRNKALVLAAGATDPLIRQQYVDLAQCYSETACALRDGDATALVPRIATDMPWRSVPLWVSNDR